MWRVSDYANASEANLEKRLEEADPSWRDWQLARPEDERLICKGDEISNPIVHRPQSTNGGNLGLHSIMQPGTTTRDWKMPCLENGDQEIDLF